MTRQLIRELRYHALHLYTALEMRRVLRPARNEEDALRRMCLHAREYYERTGGLPVHIIVHNNGAKQVFDVEDAPTELLQRAIHLLRDVIGFVWYRDEWRCRSTLSTLEHSCDHCVVASYGDANVVAESCTYCRATQYSVGSCCVYDFVVSVHFFDA